MQYRASRKLANQEKKDEYKRRSYPVQSTAV